MNLEKINFTPKTSPTGGKTIMENEQSCWTTWTQEM